jgi:hypothetical protein
MVEPFNSSIEMEYDKMVYENKGWGENMTGGASEFKSPEMQYDEMVYNKEDDKIMAGGYAVNSLLLNQGMPVAYTDQVGGKGKYEKVSDRFKHLAVPAGLYLGVKPMRSEPMRSEPMRSNNEVNNKNESTVINDDLYEKLLKLAEHDNKGKDKGKSNDKAIYKKNSTTKKKKHKKTNKRKSKRKQVQA